MSVDVRLTWNCSHLIVEEVAQLASDRRSLTLSQPIAGYNTVEIRANDEVIPSEGLYTQAVLHSTKSGPFDIIENEDSLSITTSFGQNTTKFNVRGIQRYTTDQIITKLLSRNFNIGKLENVNGHITIIDTSKIGSDSYVKVAGDISSFGFSLQTSSTGKQIYPSWQLVKREGLIVDERFPRFDFPVKGNPVFKVTYTALPDRCLRCRGSRVEHDIRYSADGNAIFIDNEDLLYQAALKILLTDRGSNSYHPWYGTTLRSRIGTKNVGAVVGLIADDIRKALVSLQTLQREQSKYQVVTTKEQLYSITNVRVLPHAQDPTTILADVTVRNASSEPITITTVFTVPGVISRLSSNGLIRDI